MNEIEGKGIHQLKDTLSEFFYKPRRQNKEIGKGFEFYCCRAINNYI